MEPRPYPRVKMNQLAKYLAQRAFSSKLTLHYTRAPNRPLYLDQVIIKKRQIGKGTTPCPKKEATLLLLPLTLRCANRFSNFFHRHTSQ